MRECGILNMSLRELNVKFPFYMRRMFVSANILFSVYAHGHPKENVSKS